MTTFAVASESAFLSVLEEIATRTGIKTFGPDKMSVWDAYHQRKANATEQLIADYADLDPIGATDLKAMWAELSEKERQIKQSNEQH